MKLNILEKFLIKIFKGTFEKIYKKGLNDTFNSIQTLYPTPNNTTSEE